MRHNVLTDEPHPQSQAALVLLHKRLLRTAVYHGYQGWLRFRLETLEKWRVERGFLSCHYCGRAPLLVDAPNTDPCCATLDHVVPRSKGGANWDVNNLVVACPKCNGKKADKPAEEFSASLN